jgi:hypothetical protein
MADILVIKVKELNNTTKLGHSRPLLNSYTLKII